MIDNDANPAVAPWKDPGLSIEERVADLLSRMTLEEKIGQLYGFWARMHPGEEGVAWQQHELADASLSWRDVIKTGPGQLTRPLGSAPVEPATGARALARKQREIVQSGRLGIPAIAHEECLTGLMTYGATVYPAPLAWGATFDPDLVERMAVEIGAAMSRLGVHQGLAPVLDVTRDPRWGRTEETIGEDPYLVGTIGTAYVRGLQSAGVIATLKHFVGYSASRAGRNHGPVAVGSRELADVLLTPFEMAVHLGQARSVMHSYAEIDGVPAAAATELLTGLLRDAWEFTGTVVADYFGVSYLEVNHRIAATAADAAIAALLAGVDVELPTVRCNGAPLLLAVRDGRLGESYVDSAVVRVLKQKCELGLLDPDWDSPAPEEVDLDPPDTRATARRLAEESVVLLENNGILPLRDGARVALVGPLGDDPMAMLGCYTFPRHIGRQYPELPVGVAIPTLREALGPAAYARGCDVDSPDKSGLADAVAAARDADVCVVAVGDQAGLFGSGTSGEGCDAMDLRLPGMQQELVEAVLATRTSVVLVLMTGRPYALGALSGRAAAIVQAFFPGEAGGPAVADVLTGRVCPSARLPVSVPREPGGQPSTYLAPLLGQRNKASAIDPTPLYPFGFGLSYTDFDWALLDPAGPVEIPTDGAVAIELEVRNVGARAGAEVVQLYLHDPVAQVTRPVVRLVGYARIPLEPGQARRVRFRVHADLTSFTGRGGLRVVEPGEIELRLSTSSAVPRHVVKARLVGAERVVDHTRRLLTEVVYDV